MNSTNLYFQALNLRLLAFSLEFLVRYLLERLLIQWVSLPHIHFREKCCRLLDYTSMEAYKISLAGHYGVSLLMK